MKMGRILIVDDDEGLLHFLCRLFSRQEYEVRSCDNGAAALELIGSEDFDLILLDYKMPGLNGLDTLKQIRNLQVKTPIIVMTAYGTMDTAIEAMKLGAYDYILKPFDKAELEDLARDALEVNRLMKEIVSFPASEAKPLPAPGDEVMIIGSHRRMQEVYKLIGQVAAKDVRSWSPGNRVRERSWPLAPSIITAAGKISRFLPSTAPPFRKPCSRASCSGMSGVPSRVPSALTSERLKEPMAEPSSSMKSESCLFRCRPSFCA